MKYIFKLTIFALLGLLLVSCSKSSSKHNASIKLQGVLEKGKATDAICKISTLDGKVYSKSNHIDNGGYVATVPAGAFDITCTIKKYINDNKTKTVKQITPKSPLVLEAISFAKARKNKTVNVNVITDLVAKEIKKSKNKIKDEKSFYSTEEEAKTTALKGILSKLGQSTIEDIDTLSLQDKGILTQVSLAVQAQLDQDSNMTIEQALTEVIAATEANSITNQDVNNLNPDAIGIQLPKDTKPPKPIVTDTEKPANPPRPAEASISMLDGITIAGQALNTHGSVILLPKTSSTIEVKIPVANIIGVMDSKKIWITRMGDHTSLELIKQGNFYQVDIKNLLNTASATGFTICSTPSTRTASTVNCFQAFDLISAAVKLASPNITDLTGATINGQAITTDGTATVGETTSIDFKLPASKVVELLNTKKVWITGKTGTAKELTNKDDFYQNANIKDLFNGSLKTTFQVCILPSTIIESRVNCSDADAIGMKSFTAIKKTITDFTGAKIAGKAVVADSTIIGIRWTSVDFKLPIANILGWASVASASLTGNEKVWITSNKGAGAIELIKEDNFYQTDEIKNLFKAPKQETTFQVCIFPSTSIASTDCSGAIVMKSFKATMAVIPTITTFKLGDNIKIAQIYDVMSSPKIDPISGNIGFQMPLKFIPNLGENQAYISSKINILPLQKASNSGYYSNDEISSLFDGSKPTEFTICTLPKDITPKIADCNAFPTKQTFTATLLSGIYKFNQNMNIYIGQKDAGNSPTGIDTTNNNNIIPFIMPSIMIVNLGSDNAVYITSDKPSATIQKLISSSTSMISKNVADLFKTDGTTTTFTVCILPKTLPAGTIDCSTSTVKQTFRATALKI